MRVSADTGKCQGHAQCNVNAPEVYPLDEYGYVAITDVEVPAAQQDGARRGADACPERALTIVE